MTSMEVPDGIDPKELEKVLAMIAKKKSTPANEDTIVFGEIQTDDNQMLKVLRSVYKGRESLRIQNFWREDEHQDWQFGRANKLHYENIEELLEGLQAMKEWCEENPG